MASGYAISSSSHFNLFLHPCLFPVSPGGSGGLAVEPSSTASGETRQIPNYNPQKAPTPQTANKGPQTPNKFFPQNLFFRSPPVPLAKTIL
jgi:hypothetical protein